MILWRRFERCLGIYLCALLRLAVEFYMLNSGARIDFEVDVVELGLKEMADCE